VYPLDSRLDRPQSLDAVKQGNPHASARIEPLFVGVAAPTDRAVSQENGSRGKV